MKKNYSLLAIILWSTFSFAQSNTFIQSTSCYGTWGYHIITCSADFDGDGDNDFIYTNDNNANYWMYSNDGIGNFTQSSIFIGQPSLGKIVAKDMDNDGDVDLVTTSGKIFLNDGYGAFSLLSGTFFTATGSISNVLVEDFNGDNKKDILWLNGSFNSSSNNQLWFNSGTTGNPNFLLSSEFDNIGVSANNGSVSEDIDNDGDKDFVICAGGGFQGKVFKNNGNGVFTNSQNFTTYTGTGFLVDWDKDGDIDFLAYDGYNNWGFKIWKNDGTGTFGPASPSLITMPNSIGRVELLVDLNGDSWLDVVTAASATTNASSRYLINNGCELILNSQLLGNSYYSIVAKDFNNDGKPDFIYGAREAVACLYTNDLATQPYVALPSNPTVSTPVSYSQGATANALTATLGANSTGLLWYTTATGGTGSTTAPTPSTSSLGNTSYWVSSINSIGCESERTQIVVQVAVSATHLNFDGIDDKVDLGNSLTTYFTSKTAVTLEAWVKPETNTGLAVIVGNWVTPQESMQMLLRRDGNSYTCWIEGGTGYSPATATNAVVLNTWQHVVGTWDGTTIKIYVNGVLASSSAKTGAFPASTNNFIIGYNNFNENFKGSIDEVRIWDVARTEEQINRSKNCELQGNETGLVAYYKFNQGLDAGNNSTITTLIDATSNANNGTFSGTPLTGATSNFLAGSPVTTGIIVPSNATVSNPVVYNQGATATALTATTGTNGTGLLWYTTATDGMGSTSAPTPTTTTSGNTSYWVTSTNTNGCESARTEIVVQVNAPATQFKFDGVDDYIYVENNSITLDSENQTFQAWINIASIPTTQKVFLQRGQDGYGGWNLQLGVQPSGKVTFVSCCGAPGVTESTTLLTPNQWYHVTAIYENGPTGNLKLYINGVLESTSATLVNPSLRPSWRNLLIGGGNTSTEYFNGSIDEVRVWNKILTLTDITNTMNCEIQTIESGLKAYYKFNQGFSSSNNGTETSLVDSSSFANNGTFSGIALNGLSSNFLAGSPITTGNTCTYLNATSFEINSKIKMYPNPTIENITIEVSNLTNASLQVLDITGKVLMNQTLNNNSNSINTQQFPSGIYLFKVTSNEGTATNKVIKH